MTTNRRKLTGNRNQCAGCGEFFNSNGAFDKHRIGKHGIDRRCMTPQEMVDAGFFKPDDGFWRGSEMPAHVLSAHSPDDDQECATCCGTGEGLHEGQTCSACKGRGY